MELHPKLTLLTGPNGHGKTNLLEALDLLSGRRSFRGAQVTDLISVGQTAAFISADIKAGRRELRLARQFEAGPSASTSKASVNGNFVKRLEELGEVFQTVVFTPADLDLAQGSPSGRRAFLDEVAGAISRDYNQHKSELDKILRQRNALLKQERPYLNNEAKATLEIWDEQLASCAKVIGAGRAELVARLQPLTDGYYARLAGLERDAENGSVVELEYQAPWRNAGDLEEQLRQRWQEDVRRGTTSIGPHRDELAIRVNGLSAGSHCSQGEQRSVVLALRLAQHHVLGKARGDAPVILLDDVFSELDNQRSQNLIGCLPECQIVITSATGTLPAGLEVGECIELRNGTVLV